MTLVMFIARFIIFLTRCSKFGIFNINLLKLDFLKLDIVLKYDFTILAITKTCLSYYCPVFLNNINNLCII